MSDRDTEFTGNQPTCPECKGAGMYVLNRVSYACKSCNGIGRTPETLPNNKGSQSKEAPDVQ